MKPALPHRRTVRLSCSCCLVVVLVVAALGCTTDTQPRPDPATQAFLDSARVALDSEDYERTVTMADSATARMPLLTEAYVLRGTAHRAARRFDEAYVAYKQATILDSARPGLWRELAAVSFAQGRYREAAGYYNAALDLLPQPDVCVELAESYLKLGEVDSARAAFEQAAALDSTFTPAFFGLAEWHRMTGAFDTALTYVRRTLQLDPSDVEARYLLGALLVQTGAHEEALAELEQVVEARPWFYEAHHSMGQALLELGRTEEGETALMRGDRYRMLDAEVRQARNGILDEPGQARHRTRLGSALRRAGRLEEALDAYRASLALNPENPAVRNDAAGLYLAFGDTIRAVQEYIEALRADSTFVEAWLNLAVLYQRFGRTEDSRLALRRAIRSNPDHPALRRYLEEMQRQLAARDSSGFDALADPTD